MKRFRKKQILMGAFAVVALTVGVPLIINACYKANGGYITMWSAADVLSYYGTMIAALIGVVGVYCSIYAANKNYRDDVRARVLPFLALTPFERKASVNTMALLKEQTNRTKANPETGTPPAVRYEEYKLNRVYFVITRDGVDAKAGLSKTQQNILEQCGNAWVTLADGVKALQHEEYHSFPMEVENVGNGTAVNLRVGFNRTDKNIIPKYVRPIMLKQGQTLYIHIFSTEEHDVVKGDYALEFYYEDIYGNKYTQAFPVHFDKNDDGEAYQSVDLMGKQIPLTATANAN